MFYIDLLERLYRHHVKYLIVGGLAVNLYGVQKPGHERYCNAEKGKAL
jgi:hypothetical protein